MQYATSFNALHLSWRLWVFPQDEGGGSMAELGPIQTTVWISLPMVWCSLRIGLFPPLTDQRMPHGSSACMAQARGFESSVLAVTCQGAHGRSLEVFIQG